MKYLVATLSISLGIVGGASCSLVDQTRGAPLRIAFNTWIGYSSFYIAEERGFFEDRGIKVETSVIDSLAEKNAAMLRGDLDGMGGTIDSAIVSAAAGLDARIVMMFDRSNGTDGILVASGIKSLDDLVKQPIAVEEGFVGHFFLLYLLEKAGISQDSLTLVSMTTDQAGVAFAAGQIDAAVTWEPYLSTALQREGAKVLISSAEVEPILADTLLIRASVIKDRPRDVEMLVEALIQANEFWRANPEEGNAVVAKQWNLEGSDVAAIMETTTLYGRGDQLTQFGETAESGLLSKFLGKCNDLWLQAGIITESVDTTVLVDKRFVLGISEVE